MEGGVVDLVAVGGPEEVGDAEELVLALPREVEAGLLGRAGLVGPDHEVVAVAVGGEVAVDDLRDEQAARLRLGQLLAQRRPDARLELVVVLAVLGAELPLVAEQRRLVDEAGDVVDGDALHHLGAEERGLEHLVVGGDLGGAGRQVDGLVVLGARLHEAAAQLDGGVDRHAAPVGVVGSVSPRLVAPMRSITWRPSKASLP